MTTAPSRPPRAFAARAGGDLPRPGSAAWMNVDFSSHEPAPYERLWGAVARPSGPGTDFGLRLVLPLRVLSMPEGTLFTLFREEAWMEAAKARARALLKLRAEAMPDVGGC